MPKSIENGRTTSKVTKLDATARLRELVLMLGEVSESTLHSTNDLLQSARAASAEKK